MDNVLDYVKWRGDLTFDEHSFNEIDNLIMAEVIYVDFKDAIDEYPSKHTKTYKEAADRVFANKDVDKIVLGLIVPNTIVKLADSIRTTKRFSNLKVSNYVNIIDIQTACQFAAMCFHINKNLIYVSYRGTDDTIIGWQENLNLVKKGPVEAEVKAAKYLNEIAKLFPKCELIVGGHSKGGNLATYAAIYCDDKVKKRIIKVYNNDGPGFLKENIDNEKFLSIKSKIVRIIPHCSVVGLLLDSFCGKTYIVSSNAKGVNQHDAFSWEVCLNHFVKVKDLALNAKKLDTAITNMISNLTEEERNDLAVNVYNFVIELNKNTLIDCHNDPIRLIKYLNKITSKNRKIFMQLMYNFIKYKQL